MILLDFTGAAVQQNRPVIQGKQDLIGAFTHLILERALREGAAAKVNGTGFK